MKETIIIVALLSIVVLSGCKTDYEDYYDSCIERHPEWEGYCECIGTQADGQWNLYDGDYELCFPLIEKEECPKQEEKGISFLGKGEWKFFNDSQIGREIPDFEEDCKEVTCDCYEEFGCMAKCYRC